MIPEPQTFKKGSEAKIQGGPQFNKQNFIRDLRNLNRTLFSDESENEKRRIDKTPSK